MNRIAIATLAAAALAGGCKKQASAPPAALTGLGAVPASAEVVVAIDVRRVIDAPLVARAVSELLVRDSVLANSWAKVQDACKLDVGASIKRVMLAIGPHTGAQPGTGPVLLIATGKLVETELAGCIRAMVGQGGGSLTARPLGTRTLYEAKDGNRVMFFAFGTPDTVLMSASEPYITEALGDGKKLPDNPDMAKWIALANQQAPIWAAGRADERVRQGMVKVAGGQITSGPVAYTASLDPTGGVKLEVDAVMATPADAKTLESFAKTQLGALGMVAQAKSLGTIVDKVSISADGAVLRLRAALDLDEVNQVISVLDGGGGSAQDAPPQGSGSQGK